MPHPPRRTGRGVRLSAAAAVLLGGVMISIPGLTAPNTSADADDSEASPRSLAQPPASAEDAAPGPCKYRPNASNSGARGELEDRGVTTLGEGQTLEDARVQGLEVTGSDVTIRNVAVDGTILVTGDRVRIRRTTAQGIFVSSGSQVSVKRSKIADSPGDAFHVTSDRGEMVQGVKLHYNFVHRPVTPSENHYDGVQVRGVDGMSISCSTFRAGPFHDNFNAAVFLEDANGGTANVRVRNNWLFGFAYSVMVDSPTSTFTGNTIGGDIKWGPCLQLESAGKGFTSSGNTWAETGRKANLCGQG